MMYYGTQSYGQRNVHCQMLANVSAERAKQGRTNCSEKAKAGLRQQYRPSGAKTETFAGGMMAKNKPHYQTTVHKNITRVRFIRNISPAVGAKMRELLEMLKRKESDRE